MYKNEVFIKGYEDKKYLFSSRKFKDNCIRIKSRENMGMDDRISIVSDAMFKAVFMSEHGIKYAAKLLSGILNQSYEYLAENLQFQNTVFPKGNIEDKGEIGDFVAKIGDTFISIEMNVRDMLMRNAEYVDRLYSYGIKVGNKGYNYHIVVQININNFYFEEHEEVMDVYFVQNDKGEIYIPKYYIEIYIPNLRKKYYNKGKESLNQTERCILAMIETSTKTARELSKGDDILEEFTEMTKIIEENNLLKEAYDHEYEYGQAMREEGYEEGSKYAEAMREEGYEEGSKYAEAMREEGYEEGSKYAEAMREEGYEEGYKAGLKYADTMRQEVIKHQRLQSIKNMVSKGYYISDIATILEISKEEVEKILEEEQE